MGEPLVCAPARKLAIASLLAMNWESANRWTGPPVLTGCSAHPWKRLKESCFEGVSFDRLQIRGIGLYYGLVIVESVEMLCARCHFGLAAWEWQCRRRTAHVVVGFGPAGSTRVRGEAPGFSGGIVFTHGPGTKQGRSC